MLVILTILVKLMKLVILVNVVILAILVKLVNLANLVILANLVKLIKLSIPKIVNAVLSVDSSVTLIEGNRDGHEIRFLIILTIGPSYDYDDPSVRGSLIPP